MLLPIVHYNDPVLRKKGVKITRFDSALTKLGRDMLETMQEARGIGLAAQQIGQAIQFCVVDVSPLDIDFDWDLDGNHPPLDLIMPMMIANPVVTVHPSPKEIEEEGCLSFPQIRGDVVRHDEISVEFQDAQGVPHILICNGMFARCVQHEVDHLNGVLFIDRMAKKVRTSLDKAIRELSKKTREEKTPPAAE